MLLNSVDKISGEILRVPGSPSRTWSFPQCSFLMECSSSVLEQIRLEVEGGRNLPHGERETGGVLFGVHEPDRIRILECKPLQCEYAMGPGFVLSEKDERRLAQLITGADTAPDLNGLEALGWYHSHIRSRIFLSERDRQIHVRYFAAPYQIALVVHPGSDGQARAGFFFLEPSGDMRTESSYEEFTLGTAPPAAAPEYPQVMPKQAPSRKRRPSRSKPEPRQREAICPKCGSKQVRRSRRQGPFERFYEVFGFYPYRCHECLSRSFVKTSPDLLEIARSGSRKRPEERKRIRQRTRREILLWGGGIIGFLVILLYLIRDTGPKSDQP
jgi:proteasome lid subunit RPN8/RPN11